MFHNTDILCKMELLDKDGKSTKNLNLYSVISCTRFINVFNKT